MARGGSDLDVELVKEEAPDEQWIKSEVEIEEHELLQHPRVRAALPHLALAVSESQLLPAESFSAETFPDNRQAALERDINLEPELLSGEGGNEGTVTEEDALVAGRFYSRVEFVVCGVTLPHSDCYCAECGQLCSSRSALLRHQQAHCAPECNGAPRPPEGAGDKAARRYECDICHYTSKIRIHMVCHMRTHTGEKPFKCSVCEYRCNQKSYLSRHIRTHTGEKPFKCNLCDYRSGTRGCLSEHMRTHTGEKPFKCNLCDYRSAARCNLTKHKRTHTGEKIFKCNLCDYRGVTRSCLTYHIMTIHTGEAPFQCHLCDYRSASRSKLNQHLRTHSEDKPFKCDLCDYRSVTRSNLTRHIKTHSRKKPVK